MASFTNYMTSYVLNRATGIVNDLTMGRGKFAEYYDRGVVKAGNQARCRVERDSTGKVTNKFKIIKMLLDRSRQFKNFALRIYVANNRNNIDASKLNFAVVAKLPPIVVEFEKSNQSEINAILEGYDLLTRRDRDWLIHMLKSGQFRLNELNAVRFEILGHLVDMNTAISYAFKFLYARVDYYFGNEGAMAPNKAA